MLPSLLAGAALWLAPALPPTSAKAALQPYGRLVGSWKATGYPNDPREDRQSGFWAERITAEWRFKGDDAWLTLAFDKGKHFSAGELRYDPVRAEYRLVLTTPDQQTRSFTSRWVPAKAGQPPTLTLARADPANEVAQRFVLRLLHANRILYSVEAKPANRALYARQYQVGATKEGESFADVPKGPECVVSGGEAKTPVTHNGKTYYVCCSGCREAFKDDPEKYIKEYEATRKK